MPEDFFPLPGDDRHSKLHSKASKIFRTALENLCMKKHMMLWHRRFKKKKKKIILLNSPFQRTQNNCVTDSRSVFLLDSHQRFFFFHTNAYDPRWSPFFWCKVLGGRLSSLHLPARKKKRSLLQVSLQTHYSACGCRTSLPAGPRCTQSMDYC